MARDGGDGKYDGLSRDQLVKLLEKHDRTRKLGLVWERDEIERDRAVDADFVSLTVDPTLSDEPDGEPWPNLVIEGDNFDALRWLRMTQAGRIKCIYVDPPYNTGKKDWVYNDHYVNADDRYPQSTWLEFLYQRFTICRDLLSDDGVILVSINDENRAKMELMLEEALPGMRAGSVVWRTRVGGNEGGDAFLSDNHEHVLIFAMPGFRFGGTEKTFANYSNPDNDPDGDWKGGGDLTVAVGYTDKRSGKGYYPLTDPSTGVFYPCNPEAVWRYASRAVSGPKARIKTRFMEDWIARGQIIFPTDNRVDTHENLESLYRAIDAGDVPGSGNRKFLRRDLPGIEEWVGRPIGFGTPSFKRYKKDLKNTTQPLSSWVVPRSEIGTEIDELINILSGTTDEGTREIKEIFGGKAFNYPKPPSLIRGLLEQATSPDDLVLDFFAGSGTTGQAVMQLNAADGGDRRFILVSSTERTAEAPNRNIARDVTAERIRRLNASMAAPYADLYAPFVYARTRGMAFEDIDYELTPAEAWTALQARHGLPLKLWPQMQAWASHETDDVVLILADRVTDDLVTAVRCLAHRRARAFIYAWAPGQLTEALGPLNIEVRSARDALVNGFRRS